MLLFGGCVKHRLHLVYSRLKLLGVGNASRKHCNWIDAGKAAEIAVSLRQGWTPGRARCGNRLRELNGVHAAACQRLMRILHEPKAIVAVGDAADRAYPPLAALCRSTLLAAPQLGPPDLSPGRGQPI